MSVEASLEAYAQMAETNSRHSLRRGCPAGPRRRHGRVRPVRARWLGPDRDASISAVARARLPAQRLPRRLPRARAARARGGSARASQQLRGDPQRRGAPQERRGGQGGGPRRLRSRCTASTEGKRRPTGGSRRRWTLRSVTGCWKRLQDSTAGTGSPSRPVGQGVGATWRGEAHGYRESVCVTALTGKAIAELDGADLAAARAEALGHIWAHSRRQRSWFRKLGASRVDHRSAVKTIVSRLQ